LNAQKIILRLYVTGLTASATQAIACVQSLKEHLGEDQVEVEIVDVLDHPLRAVKDDVYATPTLIRFNPAPMRRVFGSFTSVQTLVDSLQLA
jgi:circadian clock protein KaiB